MQNYTTGRWVALQCLTAVFVLCSFMLEVRAEGGAGAGGGSGSGGGTGGVAAGGSMGSPGSTGSGGTGMSRGKNFDGTLKTPDKPGISPQQRDRAQRLEEKLRQGEAPPPTPQTQMSDRLERLHKNSSPEQSGSSDTGQ